ncbi:hypothetical protein NST69_15555 [Paenibacillus sp. FSL P2-0089]|uniref:hypothetical protein n=1 Tax=Paenibacillus sp. FSL P2-0089 TaxID=2954526 RepID=UPI00315AF172
MGNPQIMLPEESLECLKYLFNELLNTKQRIQLQFYNDNIYIPNCIIKSIKNDIIIELNFGGIFYLNSHDITSVTFDFGVDEAIHKDFKSKFTHLKTNPEIFDFMISFSYFDEIHKDINWLSVKLL